MREIEKKIRKDTINEFLTELCIMIIHREYNGDDRFYADELKQLIADVADKLDNRE